MTISERLFELMEQKGVTAYSICQKTGLNNSTVSNWRIRNTDPPAKYLIPICEMLGCSLSYLLTGVDEKGGIRSRRDAVLAGYAPTPDMREAFRDMSVSDRVISMMGLRLLGDKDVIAALGIEGDCQAIADFKAGKILAKDVVPLCELLGCSVDLILYGDEGEGVEADKPPAPEITRNGRDMLMLFNALPEREQLMLMGRLQEMNSPILRYDREIPPARASSDGKAV